jgi:hypothetical protein
MNNPNSFDEEVQDAQANPDTTQEGTEQTVTVETPVAQVIDYETKFRESAKEAQRLYSEKKKLEEQLANRQSETFNTTPDTELFDGFGELDEDAQRNLLSFADTVRKKALDEVYKDPAIAFARTSYNEKRWDAAFAEAVQVIPELADKAQDFRTKYYNPTNVPDNMADIIKDLAKIYLFDSAKEVGAKEEAEKSKRINLEDVTGGDKNPPSASRSMAEWQRLAQENPQKFASLSKEFNEDLAKN